MANMILYIDTRQDNILREKKNANSKTATLLLINAILYAFLLNIKWNEIHKILDVAEKRWFFFHFVLAAVCSFYYSPYKLLGCSFVNFTIFSFFLKWAIEFLHIENCEKKTLAVMTCISPAVVILNIILAITFDDVVDAVTATITVVINK